ncbi:F3F9.8 [Arabidopsis thaliana]|nr:F3F9.8 [Arabidopsis thaliana]
MSGRGKVKSEPMKVVFINTQYVETDARSFKTVVQELTGKNAIVAAGPFDSPSAFDGRCYDGGSKIGPITNVVFWKVIMSYLSVRPMSPNFKRAYYSFHMLFKRTMKPKTNYQNKKCECVTKALKATSRLRSQASTMGFSLWGVFATQVQLGITFFSIFFIYLYFMFFFSCKIMFLTKRILISLKLVISLKTV